MSSYACPGGCYANLDERDTVSCWRCGYRIEPAPEALTEPANPHGDSFNYLGYGIKWEDYKPGFVIGEVRGEWVATADNGVGVIRMPAITSNIAGVTTRTAEKLRTLRKLLALLDGAE